MMIWLSLVFSVVAPVSAARNKPVIVVVANYLTLDDVTDGSSFLSSLVTMGGTALVNTGAGHPGQVTSRYLAIGCGDRMSEPATTPTFRESKGSSGKMLRLKSGIEIPCRPVECVGLSTIKDANPAYPPGSSLVGLLGDAYHSAGLKTAVIASPDLNSGEFRGAPLIAMDGQGKVDCGVLSRKILKSDSKTTIGVSDDPKIVVELINRLASDCSLIVFDFGDLSRVEAMRGKLSSEQYHTLHMDAVAHLSELMQGVMDAATKHDGTLVLCSPCRAASRNSAGSDLTPVILSSSKFALGLLTSGTTRIPGLIRNVDLAPTILQASDLRIPRNVLGEPVVMGESAGGPQGLLHTEALASRNYRLQLPALGFTALFLFVLIFAAEITIRRKVDSDGLKRLISFLLVFAASLPAAFLFVDSIGGLEGAGYAAMLLIFAALLTIAAGFLSKQTLLIPGGWRDISALGIVFLFTTILVCADVATGAHLLRWSILSCDHIMGIRYYGIGNEYMGILVGMAMILPMVIFRDSSKASGEKVSPAVLPVLLIWFAVVSFIVGYPTIGANVGGLMTAVPTFGVALIGLMTDRVRVRDAVLLAVVSLLIALGFAVMDVFHPGVQGPSHLGRAFSMAGAYGPKYLFLIAARKIGMHLGIMFSVRAFLPIVGGVIVMVLHGRRLRSTPDERCYSHVLYRIGLPASVVGMIAAFLFNDSGIVPAGLIMGIFVISSFFVSLQKVDEECE